MFSFFFGEQMIVEFLTFSAYILGSFCFAGVGCLFDLH